MKKIFENSSCLTSDELKAYLQETMDEEQRYRAENHLLDCPLCTAAVEGFANQYDFDKDKQLEELQERFSPPAAKARPPRRFSLFNRIAAALLLLVVSLAALLYWQSQSSERLYQAYFQQPDSELLASVRSANAGSPLHPDFDKAMQLFNDQRYKESTAYFRDYLNSQPENAAVNFYAGVALLESGEAAAAAEQLETARINSEQFYEEASWYLALAHIRMEEPREARTVLKELLKYKDGFYKEKATALLEKIK